MPIIQENPAYFSDNSGMASMLKNNVELERIRPNQQQPRYDGGSISSGARRKHSTSSYDDTEDGVSEMETLFLSSCESNKSFSSGSTEPTNIQNKRNITNNNGYSRGSLKRNCKVPPANLKLLPPTCPDQQHFKSSGISSLTRLGQLFKKSKSKLSVGSDQGSHASTVESSGLGSPTATCTPDSSLSIYTNSLDGDSQSHSSTSTNNSSSNNQIDSPKLLSNTSPRESMEDRFCSTYTFDDCGIFAANMYYNVGESSVFTIYHQNGNNNSSNKTNNTGNRHPSKSGRGTNSTRRDELEDCVQPYYNNTTFSTFPNPKRCSVASAASTTTSSIVPVPTTQLNSSNNHNEITKNTTQTTTKTSPKTHPHNSNIQHDGDGYLRPNEPRTSGSGNLRNVKQLYINDSVIERANRNGQVQQVQVDVHTPTSASHLTCSLNPANSFSDGSNSGGFNSSVGGASTRFYHFDSAGSTTSAATTLVAGDAGRAGGSSNFSGRLPDNESSSGFNKSQRSNHHQNNAQLPIYMNRAYFGSNSFISPASVGSSSSAKSHHSSHSRIPISPSSGGGECEPYCSLCASSIMGTPRQRSRMDVAIVKSKECFFSREAEAHIRSFFDNLMKEDKQKLDVKLKSYDLKDLDHPTDNVVVHCAKVQIVIISHHFLQRLKDESSRRPRLSPINRVFRSKSVIAVLLAVSADEVLDSYESVLPRFREWFSVDLRSTNKYDPEFSKKFTDQVLLIYNLELSNSSNFSVFPKKVTREQPKICIIFRKPIEKNDEVRIELKTQRQVSVISEVKLENPHSTLIRIPESLTPEREAIVDVSVFVNKHKIGGSKIKSELNLRRMDEDDLIDRMEKLLPPFVDMLDQHISDTLLKHYRQRTDYNADPELELMNGIIICKADILPTIMHFAAYYGLRKTAFTVLDEAEGLSDCNIRNELDETPSDVAFTRGHAQIGHLIGDYQEVSNSYTAYRYIKELIEKDTGGVGEGSPQEDAPEEKQENHVHPVENGALFFMNPSLAELSQSDDNNETSTSTVKNEYLELPEEENAASTSSSVELGGELTTVSEGAPSEVGSGMKSEDDEVAEMVTEALRKPTPSFRRRINHPRRREYVNVDGNPSDNPEIVQPRGKVMVKKPSIENARKRHSILQYYDVPRTRDQDYKMPPPEVRPVRHESESSEEIIPVTNAPVLKKKSAAGPQVTTSGYLIMNDGLQQQLSEMVHRRDCEPAADATSPQPDPPMKEYPPTPRQPRHNTPQGSSPSPASSSTSSKEDFRGTRHLRRNNNNQVNLDTAEEQLIELMNDAKNNTYDMRTIELLFENWKQSPNVKKSFEDKMKMLEHLRKEFSENSKGFNKKLSTFAKLKFILTKRKKSVTSLSEITQPIEHDSYNINLSSSNNGIVSPTGLTFTGPNLPSQPFPNTVSPSPPLSTPFQNPPHSTGWDSRASESSRRTSIDSRYSDSSADSEKAVFSSNDSNKPLEYHNPMSKRFIPSYICPNPGTQSSPVTTGQSPAAADLFNESYMVPPPPRPVKPGQKLSTPPPQDTSAISPKLPKKPPAIPEEVNSPVVSPALPRKPSTGGSESSYPPPVSPSFSMSPPAIPAKPEARYLAEEPDSPPPQPPPRNNTSPNPFSYIDYRKKNQGAKEKPEAETTGKAVPYENMNSDGTVTEATIQTSGAL